MIAALLFLLAAWMWWVLVTHGVDQSAPAEEGLIIIKTKRPIYIDRMTTFDNNGNRIVYTNCTLHPGKPGVPQRNLLTGRVA